MSATVSITIVGRTYEISCDDGQEEYLRTLAAEVDRRASELMRSVGQVGDARLLVMLTLLMADEIADLRRRKDRVPSAEDTSDAALAAGIDALARRVDAIADRLEKA